MVRLRLSKISLTWKLLFVASLAFGGLFAFVDSRPTWDDTGVLAFGILVTCGVFGALGPRQPWLWALAVGLWIPVHGIVTAHNYGSLLALVFSMGGAYAGMGVRRIASAVSG